VVRQSLGRLGLLLFLATSASLVCVSSAAAQAASRETLPPQKPPRSPDRRWLPDTAGSVSRALQIADVANQARAGNWLIHVVGKDGQAFEGRAGGILDGRLMVGARRVAVDSIQFLQRGTRDGSGAVIGALIGALAGATVLAQEALSFRQYGAENQCPKCEVTYRIWGAVVTGLVGGWIGRTTHPGEMEWKSVWP
jgi:hypothetical protein